MSYELRIWDPSRHAPLPASAAEALDIMERLTDTADPANPTLETFATRLAECHENEPSDPRESGGLDALWGSDPRDTSAACRTAVYQLSLPSEPAPQQMSLIAHAAAECGLIVFDNETGMCVLPDGTVFPEDMREMWASTLAEAKAGPPAETPDSRTLLQKIAGELFDAIGRGNNHQ